MQVDSVKIAIHKLKVLELGNTGSIDAMGNSGCGICYHIARLLDGAFLVDCFGSWEHYSGDDDYPVPYVDGDTWYDPEYDNDVPIESAEEAYEYVDGCKYSGEYGELRRDLAHHIREKLEEWLEENDDEW